MIGSWLTLVLSAFLTPPADVRPWATHDNKDAGFSFDYPKDWTLEREDGHIYVGAPNDVAHVFVNAFRKGREPLESFAESRFSVQSDTFKRLGRPTALAGPNWQGLIEEADDTAPDRKENTRRVVLCAKRGDLFVTIALYMDPDEWATGRATYDRLLRSLRFAKE